MMTYSNFLKLTLFFIANGALFSYYEHLDNNGVLQENILSPLSMFGFLLAFLIIVFVCIFWFVKYLFSRLDINIKN